MQLRVLGSIDLRSGGCSVPVRGARLVRLLSALAARVDRVVATDALAEVIWPAGPPASATGAIQVAVSQARRLLDAPDAPAIVTAAGGYRLVATPDQLDLLRFDELVAGARTAAREGRTALRASHLEHALALWRGAPFGGLDDAGLLAAESRRLDERRLVADEDLLACLLQLGRHADVLERVGVAIDAHPYRERFVGLAMVALYRSGRQSEALDAYERLRRRLRDDLGLVPGDELRLLERMVLLQDPSLDATERADTAASEVATVHVWVEGPPRGLGAAEWSSLVASLGGEPAGRSNAAFPEPAAALSAGRAAAATGTGVGLAASPGVAELLALAAPPGRLLLDAATADWLRGSGVDGVLADLGDHRLADLGVPMRIVEWAAAESDASRAPIRSCSVVPIRLGTDPTPFVGRRVQRARVAQVMRSERTVSLVGPPGAGKTRLARRVAAEQAWQFPGGAWLVELAPVDRPDDLLSAVAAVLGLTLRAGLDPIDEVARRLARQPALIVLDNAEQIAGAVARFVESVAQLAPATTVIITSRQRLDAAGECVVVVDPLSGDGDLDDARAILRARVIAANGPAMDADQEVAIVRRVDGLPLALELVAPQVAALGVTATLARLDDLVVNDVLDASFRTSEERLSPIDRVVLRRLSVFAGPFTLAAAEHVVADPATEVVGHIHVPVGAVAGAVSRLVDASLIGSAEVAGSTRHHMLVVLRALAARRLESVGEGAAVRRRHARWVSRAAWEHAGALVGRRSETARAELDVMLPDLRAALAHLAADDDSDRHVFAVAGLWFYWYFSGRLSEGRAQTLAAVHRPGGRPEHRALGLAAAANLAWWQCDYREARRCLEAARSLGDVPSDVAFLDIVDGSLAWIAGDLERASAHLGAALDRARSTSGYELPMAAAMAGNVMWWRGDHLAATALYREGREASIARRNRYTEALCARHEGLQLGLLGHVDDGRALLRDALAECRSLADVMGVGQSLVYAGLVELEAELPERAAVLLAEGVRTAVQPGDLFCLVVAAPALARLFADRHDAAAAARWLGWRAATMARAGLTPSADDHGTVAALGRELSRRLGPDADARHRAAGSGMDLDDLSDLVPV